MSELEHIVREFYRRMGNGDLDGIIELLSEHITWSVPGPPVVPYAGTFHGRDGVAEFFRILAAHEDLQSFTAREFIVDERSGGVCVLGSETGVALTTGKRFSVNWAEVFRVREELIIAFEEHIDTFGLAEAYAKSPASRTPVPAPDSPG